MLVSPLTKRHQGTQQSSFGGARKGRGGVGRQWAFRNKKCQVEELFSFFFLQFIANYLGFKKKKSNSGVVQVMRTAQSLAPGFRAQPRRGGHEGGITVTVEMPLDLRLL